MDRNNNGVFHYPENACRRDSEPTDDSDGDADDDESLHYTCTAEGCAWSAYCTTMAELTRAYSNHIGPVEPTESMLLGTVPGRDARDPSEHTIVPVDEFEE